uniref:Uncharacterized protein n=1 Tax=Caenorhabditis japonica TaxID=281687 RepID=A0A8R1I4U5_CAEJA
MSSRPKRLRLSCRKVCELWFPDDETNPDECDGIGDNPMVNEETEGFWEEHVETTERHTRIRQHNNPRSTRLQAHSKERYKTAWLETTRGL